MQRICVDACFLIGLYDETDQHHAIATLHFATLFGEESARNQLVAPWPILYESLGTRFARNPAKSNLLNQHWNYLNQTQQILLLDDRPFRDLSLEEHLIERSRSLSLVDRILRAMILSQEKQFDCFLTYNTGDFADAC